MSAPCGEDLSDTMIPFFYDYLMELFYENNVLAGAAGSPGSPGMAGIPGDRGVQGRRGRKGAEGIRYFENISISLGHLSSELGIKHVFMTLYCVFTLYYADWAK